MNPNGKTLRWIWNVSGKAKNNVFLLVAVKILYSMTGVLYALLLRQVVDSATKQIDKSLWVSLAHFGGLIILTITLQAVVRYLSEKSRAQMEKTFRQRLFSQLLSRDYAEVCATHTGEWMNRMTSDVNVVVNGVTQIVPDFSGSIIRIMSAAAALMLMVPGLVIALVIGGVTIAAVSLLFRKKLKNYHGKIQTADGKVRSFIQESLQSLPVIHSFNRETGMQESAGELMREHMHIQLKRMHFVNFCNVVIRSALLGAQFLGVALCGWMIFTGQITYGAMSAILHLVSQLESPLAGISKYIPQYYSMIASAERLMEPETYAADAEKTPKQADEIRQFYREAFAALTLENVSFAYKDNERVRVLDRVSVTLKKGESLAITGESGCGKSTLLKLLLGLYKINQGEVSLETVSGERIALDTGYRSLFAYVPQGNLLFSGTVREMLSFSDKTLMNDDAKLWNALRVAAADEIIAQRPEGLDAVLGEGGRGFSEGQIQRLAIARAILYERPILLFDEATSSLDEETEKKVLNNIKEMTGYTVILVTHKEASRSACDYRLDLSGSPAPVDPE
ncbi:MAG: ABC transporter ATP-binding protein [Oscillospiraceae bacterium]|nr:ABC transporter ATP-binding protein [Oscillospiraceae bacterium]